VTIPVLALVLEEGTEFVFSPGDSRGFDESLPIPVHLSDQSGHITFDHWITRLVQRVWNAKHLYLIKRHGGTKVPVQFVRSTGGRVFQITPPCAFTFRFWHARFEADGPISLTESSFQAIGEMRMNLQTQPDGEQVHAGGKK
jgi:hypothetical protein